MIELDQAGLIDFAESVRKRPGPGLSRTFLVHGESAARAALARHLVTRGFTGVTSPAQGERFQLTGPR